MKKSLSVILAGVMLVSMFVMNVSAKVIPENAEKISLSEDFDGETQVTITGSEGSLTDGAIEADGNAYLIRSAGSGMEFNLPANYMLEFDFKALEAERVNVLFNDADCKTVQNFGVAFLANSFEAEKWYTARVTVDQSLLSGTTDNQGQKAVGVTYKEKGASEWMTAVHRNGSFDPYANNAHLQFRPHTANAKTAIGANAIGFATYHKDKNVVVDNIKVYDLTYNLEVGSICLTADSVAVPAYEKKDNLSVVAYSTAVTAPASEGTQSHVVATFDAINSVKGMPLAMHISGAESTVCDNYVATLSILSTDEAFNQWYTYKVDCVATYGSKDMKILVYRKSANSEEGYVLLENGVHYVCNDRGRISSGVGNIRFGFRDEYEHRAYGYSTEEGAVNDFTATKWEVKNVQVLSGNVVLRGFVTNADGTLTVESAVVTKDDIAAVAIACYEGGRMVDVDFVNLTNGEGDATLNVEYDEKTNDALLFVWKTIGGTPSIEALEL